jgi:hypothetical protein
MLEAVIDIASRAGATDKVTRAGSFSTIIYTLLEQAKTFSLLMLSPNLRLTRRNLDLSPVCQRVSLAFTGYGTAV